MKGIFSLLASVVLIFFQACDFDDVQKPNKQVDGEGPVVSQNLDLPAFHDIENASVSNLYVTIGSPQSVVLKAQQNIIDILKWEVTGNVLKIRIENNITIGESEEIRFDIVMEDLSKISLLGVGSVVLDGEFLDEITISLTGVGEVRAYGLETGICNIVSTGIGNCWVHARDELNVTLTGIGNVFYRGNPVVSQKITGLGSLIDDN